MAKIFKEFITPDPETGANDNVTVTEVISTDITAGLWSPDETGSLAAVYTSSIQKAVAGEFFYDLYHLDPNNPANNAEVQLSVAYGHVNGGGSPSLATSSNSTLPTQVIYSQYRNILLTSGSKFKFGGVESDDIYVLNINRARLKQALDVGNWQLGLSGLSGSRTFIDVSFDEGTNINTKADNIIASSVYNVMSGSLTTGTTGSTVYGLVFPDFGTIILHPSAICSAVGFTGSNSTLNGKNLSGPFVPYTGSAASDYQYQHEALYRSLSSALSSGNLFKARSIEKIASKNYLVQLNFNEYNYTNNPSYYTIGTNNQKVPLTPFVNNPITYITTIGLYNAANELVAVAKLSRPLQKSKEKGALIRVRLDY